MSKPAEVLLHAQNAPRELSNAASLTGSTRIPLISKTESAEDWLKLEQLIYSCLITGDEKSASACLTLLEQRFGEDNEKVRALRGVYEEAKSSGRDADELLRKYEKEIKDSPANIPLAKRRVALLKSLGRDSDAIAALCTILDLSPTDIEAWAELADLYAERAMYKQAIFCLEEVLLVQPNAWNIHSRIGEIALQAAAVSSSADKSAAATSILSALQHFSRSIELCEDYVRAYCGLKLSSERLIRTLKDKPDVFAHTGESISMTKAEKLRDHALAKLEAIARSYPTESQAPPEIVAARKILQS